MMLGGSADADTPAKIPSSRQTDNGKQNTYFSSLDNLVAQGNALPVLYGEMLVGSRTISQKSAHGMKVVGAGGDHRSLTFLQHICICKEPPPGGFVVSEGTDYG